MSMKSVILAAVILCALLIAGLMFHQSRERKELRQARTEAHLSSNQLAEIRSLMADKQRLAEYLETNLTERLTALAVASNSLDQTRATLEAVQAEAKATVANYRSMQAELQARTVRVTELEGEKDEMSKRLSELAGSINTLESQITEAKLKLGAAEGDRSYLTKELARLQEEKNGHLRQFNDLAILRAQVAYLRDQQAVARRTAWMQAGRYQPTDRKGAENLFARPSARLASSPPALNVEIEQSGSVRVVPATIVPAPVPATP